MSKLFSVHTLGCKVNQYDGQLLREHFLAGGYSEKIDPWHGAPTNEVVEDVFVLNTCTVTAAADKECARIIRRIRRSWPSAKIVVTGCACNGQDHPVLKEFAVDLFVPNQDKAKLLNLYSARMCGDSSFIPPAPLRISEFHGHCRAFVKIQDGCDEFCSYCVVPSVRGRSASRPLQDVRLEVEALAAKGYQEVVLTGIHAGSYGCGSVDLADLVEEIHDIEGIQRIRFSSMEPMDISHDMIVRLSALAKVCPHFHLPLQSGDDTVLERMRRRYTIQRYKEIVQDLRNHFEDLEITTDVIVGFPGETQSQFENTLRMAEEIQFLKMHIFPFSTRPGTRACDLPDKVPSGTMRQRCRILADYARRLSLLRRRRYVGRRMKVLVEGKDTENGLQCGYTPNYIKAFLPGSNHLANQIVGVGVISCNSRGVVCREISRSRIKKYCFPCANNIHSSTSKESTW